MDDTVIIPEGYKLLLRKRMSCPLCQRPELGEEWTEIIWSRQFSIPHIMGKINEKLRLEFSPKEIKLHQSHIELVHTDPKEERKEQESLIKNFIDREAKFIGIDTKRNRVKFDSKNQIDNRIKALSAQLVEMELNEWYNDPLYLQKIREWKSLMELKLRNEGTLVDKVEISIPVERVRELYKKYQAVKEGESGTDDKPIVKQDEGTKLEER